MMIIVVESREEEPTIARVAALYAVACRIRAAAEIFANGGVRVILAGEASPGTEREITEGLGVDLHILELPFNASWDAVAEGLEGLVAQEDCVLMSHTAMAREVGPFLAAALDRVSVSNVTAVRRMADGLVFSRPVMDNTFIQEVKVLDNAPWIATFAPGAEGVGDNVPEVLRCGQITRTKISRPGKLLRKALIQRDGAGDPGLSKAPVVVAAGRGIGERENLDMVKAFAARFPGAAMAASRPLVDQGWVPYSRQVGITGAVVKPDLYIALGISGSSQHLAGMAGSKWVVCVNDNPAAPIFRHSDLCIRADVVEFLQTYLEAGDKAK